MPFLVQANVDDHALSVKAETAKEAFAKAVEWQVERFTNVSINDGVRTYSIAEFSSEMALQEMANTIDADLELKAKGTGK